MSESLKLNILISTNNTIRILAFIGLAIYFNTWWIVFFSILFLLKRDGNEKKDDDFITITK